MKVFSNCGSLHNQNPHKRSNIKRLIIIIIRLNINLYTSLMELVQI